MIIMKILKSIINFFSKHKRGTIIGAAGLGAAGAGAGIYTANKANKINRQAKEIQQAAIERHDQAYQETQRVLAELGEAEKTAIDSFVHFADTMERIQGRPKLKTNIFSGDKLPNYEPEEIKSFSAEVQMAIIGAGGAGFGALAGLAAFGAGALVAAPAMAGAGLVLCVKGFGLKKKAIENKRQAKQMEKSVDEIVSFYTELQKAAVSFRECLNAVFLRYSDSLQHIEETLSEKTAWRQFSREEKRNVENTVLLARLLYSMTQTKIVVRNEEAEALESVNTAELEKLQKQATKLLGQTTSKQRAFEELSSMIRPIPDRDDDKELADHREEKYGE